MSPTVRALLLASFLSACLPAFDNPFDPANGGGAQLLGLTATQAGFEAVRLRWAPFEHPGVTGFRIDRIALAADELPEETTTQLVGADATEWVDTNVAWTRTYRYTLSALAGDVRSDPGASVDVTVVRPELPSAWAEHTAIGAITVHWDAPPEWVSTIEVVRVCPESEPACEPESIGTTAASALSFDDALDEGRILAWEIVGTDAVGRRLGEASQRTNVVNMDRRGPFPTNWRRRIEDQARIEVSFDEVDGAASYEGLAIRADDTGKPALVTTEGTNLVFEELDLDVGYRITIAAIGANGKRSMWGDPIWVDRRAWKPYEPQRGTHEAPNGDQPALAVWNDESGSGRTLLAALAASNNPLNDDMKLETGETDLLLRGGFTGPITTDLPVFAPPIVAVEAPFRWISPVSGTTITPTKNAQPRTGGSLTVGGDVPDTTLEGAAAALRLDGTIWLHGGRTSNISSEIRRGELSLDGGSIQWSLVTIPGVPARASHAIAWHRGSLFFLGGAGPGQADKLFARWDPVGGTVESLDTTGAGPQGDVDLSLTSDDTRLWAAGAGRIWSWTEEDGWTDHTARTNGRPPSTGHWAIVAEEFSHGPGLFVYDGVNVFDFSPVNEAHEQYTWRRIDPPPAGLGLVGAYDVNDNTVFLENQQGVWRYPLEGRGGYEQLAQRGEQDWLPGVITWDHDADRLLRYAGGNTVQSLDPAMTAPTWTTLAAPAGGPTDLVPQVARAGSSLVDFTTPTFYVAGQRGGGPQQVWSVSLAGSAPWTRIDQGTGPTFLPADACVAPPQSCWDPTGPIVYSVGTTAIENGNHSISIWKVNLASGPATWSLVTSQTLPASTCPGIDALACAYDEPALYLFGHLSGKTSTTRVTLGDAPNWKPLETYPDGGVRRTPVLVHRQNWNDLLLLGGQTTLAHDAWQLVTR